MNKKTHLSILTLIGALLSPAIQAHGPLPVSLKNAPLPPSAPGLLDGPDPIIINQQKAIQLGKALFWDMAIGSDGQACASCHFHAGADIRHKNQLHPGHNGQFDSTASGNTGGANYTLTTADFPFHQRQDPFNNNSPVTLNSDDIGGSGGTFGGQYKSSSRFHNSNDKCNRSADPVFQVNGTGTRKVTNRNAPTVINAVFYHRNFWDGRANNTFNGSSIWGDRDPDAGVWVKISSRTVQKQHLALINSSLASQALAPPENDTEMTCSGRTFADIGRKILFRHPLAKQKVHYQDSVLGSLSYSTPEHLKPGLKTTYARLIKQAFNKKYWSYHRRGPFGRPARGIPYNQMEANFSMFFGLAIQMYEATLISDDSPFDNALFDSQGLPTNLGASVRHGVQIFEALHCNICHAGPVFSANAISTNAQMIENNPQAMGPNGDTSGSGVNGLAMNHNIVNYDGTHQGTRFHDTGFFNTGVQAPDDDPGVGGTDQFGNPLSFSRQYAEYLAGNSAAIIDADAGIEQTKTCNFQHSFASTKFVPPFITNPGFFTSSDGIVADSNGNDNCFFSSTYNAYIPTQPAAAAELSNPSSSKMAFATQAAFKVPTLRNIELTGPYMHNGSMATLEQVLEFYSRGGNFPNAFTHEFITNMTQLADAQNRADVIAFLKSLTDERVRYERAPFDHPELIIPHGHEGDENAINSLSPLDADLAKDQFMVLEAVGANGRNTPIPTFEQVLAP